jgi:hypothetical protein
LRSPRPLRLNGFKISVNSVLSYLLEEKFMEEENYRELLRRGAQALQEGRREEARDLLLRCTELNESDPDVWLWLSGAVDDSADSRIALENVLTLSPNHPQALAGLRWIEENKK